MMEKEDLLLEFNKLRGSEDTASLFKCVDLLTQIQDDNLFDQFVNLNKDKLLKADPIIFIGKHINYYLYNERYQDALKILNEYQDGAFISMTVEDFLKELSEKLNNELKPISHKDYSFELLEKDLLSNNDDKESKAIKSLESANLRSGDYLSLIKSVLLSSTLYKYKILILFVLIEQQLDIDFKVKRDNKEIFTFNPSKVALPFDNDIYKKALNYLNHLHASAQEVEYAKEILSMIFVKTFPDYPLSEDNYLDMCEVIVYLAKKYLNENPSIEELKNQITLMDNVEEIIKNLEEILD